MAGDAIGTYGKGFGISTDYTKYFTSFTLAAMLLGYLIGLITIPKFLSQRKSLQISAILGILFTIGAFCTPGFYSVAFVAALGLSNALMWPSIFPMSIEGLGIIMGISGGAIIPKLFAALKEIFPFQFAFFIIMIPCYLYILFFSVRGYRLKGK